MEPLKALLLFLSFSATVFTVPLNDRQPPPKCAPECSREAAIARFSPHHSYTYALKTESVLRMQGSEQRVRIDAKAVVSAFSSCEAELHVTEARVRGVDRPTGAALAADLERRPLRFGYDDGVWTAACGAEDDSEWALDYKKAVVSALQVSARSLTRDSVLIEDDISGECETRYSAGSAKYGNAFRFTKTKRLDKCLNRQSVVSGLFPRAYQSAVTSLPLFNASLACDVTIESDVVQEVTCAEHQQLAIARIAFDSKLELRLESRSAGVSSPRLDRFRKHALQMSAESERPAVGQSEVEATARALCHQLKQDDQTFGQSVQSFAELVSQLTFADKAVVQSVAQSVKSGRLCADGPLEDVFVDACALAGSEGAAQVLVDVWGEKGAKKPSLLFALMAFQSKPSVKAIRQLIPLLKQTETPKHALLGISGLIHNARHSPAIQWSEKKAVAEEALEALIARSDAQSVAVIQAVDNIGADLSAKAVDFLLKTALDSRLKDAERVQAIRALLEALDDQKRDQLLDKVFEKTSESNEMRITAYKAVVMSGLSEQQLLRIHRTVHAMDNQDIQQYVRSHQKNLHETSDPHKRHVLPPNGPQFAAPSDQWLSMSANFESSFLFDALGVGMAVEMDVVRDGGAVPRAVTANVTFPAFGRELQLLEVVIRQKGFDALFERKMRKLRQMSAQSAFADIYDVIASAKQLSAGADATADLQLFVGVRVDGKHVLSVELDDLKGQTAALLAAMGRKLDVQSAFAVQPVNTRLRLPNANGMPVELRLNATLTAAVKAVVKSDDANKIETRFEPKFALQVEAGVAFAAKAHQKALEAVVRVQSAPVWEARAEIRDRHFVAVKVVPKDRQTLIRIDGAIYERDESGNRQMVKKLDNFSAKKCSESTRKPLGVEICSQMTSSPQMVYELFVQKTDRSMKSLDFSLEIPAKTQTESQLYRVAIETPGSDIDRQIAAELQLNRPSGGRQEAKVALRSPWMRWSGVASVKNDDKEQSVAVELQSAGRRVFALDAGLESQTRGQKREMRPRLRVQLSPESEALQMQGSISVAKGRKNQLQIQLEGNQKQFLKGSFVREGEHKGQEVRLASDLTLQFAGVELRVNGAADRSPKQLSTDLTLEYRLKGARKESLKVSAKVQNVTQSSLRKMSAFAELTSTQWPKANCHLAYNLLNKPREHVENELTVAWSDTLAQKVHVLHVTKLSQSAAETRKLENTLDVEITPLAVNYELRANADVTDRKYAVEVVGKDRSGSGKHNDLKATLDFEHVSRSPLHMTLEAGLKTAARDMFVKDELREVSAGHFAGQTQWQWAKGKKAALDYDYKMDLKGQHEMDATLKAGQRQWRHTALLRMSGDDYALKSRVVRDGQQLYDVNGLLARESSLHIDAPFGVLKAKANPWTAPAVLGLEMANRKFKHSTQIEFVPEVSLKVQSDTKADNENLFSIDSHVSRTAPSRVYIQSPPMDGRLDWDLISAKKAIVLDVKSAAKDWKHNSMIGFEPKTQFAFKSKTESKAKPFITFDSEWNSGKKSYFSADFPKQKTSLVMNADFQHPMASNGDLEVVYGDYKHKSSIDLKPKIFKIMAKSDKNGRKLQTFDYQLNRQNGLHALTAAIGPDYSVEAEAVDWTAKTADPFVRIAAKSPKFETQTKMEVKDKKVVIDSKNRRDGQLLVDLNGRLSRDANQESSLGFQTPTIRSSLQTIPAKNAKFEYNCHHLDHVTDAQWSPNAEYALESKTALKSDQKFVNFALKHNARESRAALKATALDAEVIANRQSPALKVTVATDKPYYPYHHVTDVQYSPVKKQWSMTSRTDGQNKQSLLALDGLYGHLDATTPASLDLKFGPDFTAKLRVQPFGQRFAHFETKHPDYSHVTDVSADDQSLTMRSRTEGKMQAKLDSYLTRKSAQKSHFSLQTPQTSANWEYEPSRRSALELNAPFDGQTFQHKTEVRRTAGGLTVVSKTAKAGERVLDVDAAFQPDSASHLALFSPQFETQVSADYAGKAAKVALKTARVQHVTEMKIGSKATDFESKTEFQKQTLAAIKARIEDQKHALDVELRPFALKTALDAQQRSASVDFRSKLPKGRHLLASMAAKDAFKADIAWDADKDPNQRLVVEVSARREARAVETRASVAYAGNELRMESAMASGRALEGPHEWLLEYKPRFNAERDALSLRLKHVIKGREMQCNAEYWEGKAVKVSAKVNARKADRELQVTLETTAPQNPDLELKVTFVERHSDGQLTAELKAVSVGQTYGARVDVKRESSARVRVEAVLETPRTGQQTAQAELDVEGRQLTAWVSNRNGKLLEATAKADDRSVEVELKSNVAKVPSVRAVGSWIRWQEMALTVDADAIRKVDFAAKKSGQSLAEGLEASVHLESVLAPKVDLKAKAKLNFETIDGETSVKVDDKPLMAIAVNAQKRAGVWSGAGHVVRSGAELASAALQSSQSSDAVNYALNAKASQWKGFEASMTSQKIGKMERKVSLKICRRNDVNCLDIKSDVTFAKHSSLPFEKAWLSVTKMGTNFELKTSLMEPMDTKGKADSLLGLTTGQAVARRVRNQLLVSINSHSFGFDSMSSEYSSQAFDSHLKLHFPSNRWSQIRTDFRRDRQTTRASAQLVTDASAQPLLDFGLQMERKERAIRADFTLASNRFARSPKTVQMELSSAADDLKAKLRLDLSRDPNHALTVESALNRRPMAGQSGFLAVQPLNTTVEVSVWTRDRSLVDFEAVAHVSQQSVGFVTKNTDRKGRQTNGYYLARLLKDNRFEGVFRDAENGYRLSGLFGKSSAEVSTELKVTNERTLATKDVRMSLSGKCAQFEVKSEKSVQKYHFCVNGDQNADSLAFGLQSDAKSLGIDVQVESRDQKALKLDVNWSPELAREVMRALERRSTPSEWSSELSAELSHKMAIVSRQFGDDIVEPLAALLSDETQDVLQELWRNFGPRMTSALDSYQQTLADAFAAFRRFYDAFARPLPDAIQSAFNGATRATRRACKRSQMCYKALYAFDNYGSEAMRELVASAALTALRTSHRVVMTTGGRLIDALPAIAPQWTHEWMTSLSDVTKDAFESLINSNEDLRLFCEHFRRFFAQLLKDNESAIEWPAVRRSARQMADIAFGRWIWRSSTHVLVWEPSRGRLSVEMRAPAIGQSRRLRSVMDSVKPVVKSMQKSVKPVQKQWSKRWSDLKAFLSEMSLIWTQEALVWSQSAPVQSGRPFLAKTRAFLLSFSANRGLRVKFGQNRLSVREDFRWTLRSKNDSKVWDLFRISIVSEKTVRIRVQSVENGTLFAIQWTPSRSFISLKVENLSENWFKISEKSDKKSNFSQNFDDFLCEKWFHFYIQNIPREQDLCRRSDVCSFGASLVARDVIQRLPEECLECRDGQRFGSRRRTGSAAAEAEVVFGVGREMASRDGRRLAQGLRRLSNALFREFAKRGVRVVYDVIGVDGDGQWRREWPSRDARWRLGARATPNASLSLDFLLVTSPVERRTSRHVILVESDEKCGQKALDFASARTAVTNRNLFVHVLAANHFRIRSPKARHVIGVDASRAFASNVSDAEARALRPLVRVSRDLCHVLALETNGSVFRAQSLHSKSSRAAIARRVAANHAPDVCLDCDCAVARDRVTSALDCRLCAERAATVASNQALDNAFDANQEWTQDDDNDDADDDEEVVDEQ